MLQQTRAAAAIPYYEEFLIRFPSLDDLAQAPESEVLAAWSGLGYYSRARNLRKAAISMQATGSFPRSFQAIGELPGVGPYTAAAVASIAFGLPHAVLDGNVMRVIARLTADSSDIGAGLTRKRFQIVADSLLDRTQPGAFNQAMMELGATVCLPVTPLCLVCPVSASCEARQQGIQSQLPVKLRKATRIDEELHMVVVAEGTNVLMRQRERNNRRMADFWELPELRELAEVTGLELLGTFTHTIVNHRYLVEVSQGTASASETLKWTTTNPDPAIPVTTMTRKALELWRKR